MTGTPKTGRPRRYGLPHPGNFASPEAGAYVTILDELAERLYDLVEDLPAEALGRVPEGCSGSIAHLVSHMAGAELFWVSGLCERTAPDELTQRIAVEPKPGLGCEGSELVATCRAVREQWTYPRLREMADLDRVVQIGERSGNARGVLTHVIWHWTYHSGQVGMLRRMLGTLYQWRLADSMVAPPWGGERG